MEDLERAQVRLDNIRSVEPILSALRTISLGSWRAALKRREVARRYQERLGNMLPALSPHLRTRARRRRLWPWRAGHSSSPSSGRIIVLVIGSERGLCGAFNAAVVWRAQRHLERVSMAGVQVELMALGSRVTRLLRRRQRHLTWSGPLSVTALPPYSLALQLTGQWLHRYKAHELDAVDVVYNAYRGTARYEPTVVRLLPPHLPHPEPAEPEGDLSSELWPPPIIETDPQGLYARLMEQWVSARFYELLLESATAEHSARFQLLEGATQNAERLIAELTLAVQTARKQAITREMQDLAAGAGLIGTRPE
ncbi:MAG: F0F1 ATP synthase subunit gamma [Anaerolineae bacterium]|nr:F0F1 ATP synthase subunit gamma [Anaerolineae bacterium]